MSNRKGRLGIMVTEKDKYPPFADEGFYRRLCLIGDRNNLFVFVFSPQRIDWEERKVTGYRYNKSSGRWEKCTCPLPDFIYDRCFFSDRSAWLQYRRQLKQLRNEPGIRFLGIGLQGKWQVQQLLKQDAQIAPYLPETRLVTNVRSFRNWLMERKQLFLKPQAGSQGRGAMIVTAPSQGRFPFIVHGRTSANQLFHYGFHNEHTFDAWLRDTISRKTYIAQPYLHLLTSKAEPFDLRIFVQKNSKGTWQWVGMGLRIGKPGSVTSNLHGGGHAEQAESYLLQHYGDKAESLLTDIRTLSLRIAQTLESGFGVLFELGIDIGIDDNGRIWVLEVNSKPGRSIFSHTHNESARTNAVSNPVLYACHLWNRRRNVRPVRRFMNAPGRVT